LAEIELDFEIVAELQDAREGLAHLAAEALQRTDLAPQVARTIERLHLDGARAFAGEDISDTVAAVLRDEPDWRALPAGTPASIRRLLRRCLEKDRRRRLADAADARLDLDEAAAESTAPIPIGIWRILLIRQRLRRLPAEACFPTRDRNTQSMWA
jgi:hypothetical protein